MTKPPNDGPHTDAHQPAPTTSGHLRARLLPLVMRYGATRSAVGIQVVYRSTGGGLIVGGLSYAALFALVPTLVLVIAGIFLLVDDPVFRQEAVDVVNDAFPAFGDITDTAVEGANELAAVGGVFALLGFFWGASGLYLNLTRAMERFFPGERVSGVLARVLGVVLVFIIIIAVLLAVLVAGVVSVVASALTLDWEWLLTLLGAAATLAIAGGIVYGTYRLIPSNPPTPHSARVPAALVGFVIALMTLLYGVLSPWLVSGFQAFGVMASVFVALVWLRVVFLALIYGAAMARFRDFVAAATALGECDPSAYATRYALDQEAARARQDEAAAHEMERRQAQAERATPGVARGRD